MGDVDTSAFEHWAAAQARELSARIEALKKGGGGGTSDGMDGRVSRLEAHMEHVQRDMGDIRNKLDTLLDRTANLPTRSDLSVFNWQTAAIAFAAMAIIIGGIIGGLSWIKPDAAPPPPIVVQIPAPPGAHR